MDLSNTKVILLIVLVAALIVLALLLYFGRRRKRKTNRSNYIDALYALIEGRRDDAHNLMTLAVKMGEDDVDAYIQLGNLLREKGQPEKSLQIHKNLTVRRGLGFDEIKRIQMAIAADYSDLGKTEKAIQTLKSVYRKKSDPDIALELHRLYHRNGDYDKAFSMLRDLSRYRGDISKSERASYLVSVASSLRSRGIQNEAEKYLDSAMKEDGDSPHALYLSGLTAMDGGDMDTAIKMWEKLLYNDIGFFDEVISLLEKAFFESGKFQRLENLLSALLQKNQGNTAIIRALASFFERKGEYERSLRIFENEYNPQNADPETTIDYALLHMRADRPAEGRKVLEQFMTNSGKRPVFSCSNCGDTSNVPLAYCNRCSSFNNFEKKYE